MIETTKRLLILLEEEENVLPEMGEKEVGLIVSLIKREGFRVRVSNQYRDEIEYEIEYGDGERNEKSTEEVNTAIAKIDAIVKGRFGYYSQSISLDDVWATSYAYYYQYYDHDGGNSPDGSAVTVVFDYQNLIPLT